MRLSLEITWPWLLKPRTALETIANCSLAMSGVVATTFMDLKMTPEPAEMLYLMLRLPGATAHAIEYGQSCVLNS